MSEPAEKTLFLETFGCQMNVLDSELVAGQFRQRGFRLIDDRAAADVILFNTCAVRDHAEQKVSSRLGELRAIKAARPGVVIGVIGCQAEREGKGLVSRFPHIDLLCSPNQLHRLSDLVEQLLAGRERSNGAKRKPQLALSGGIRGRVEDNDPDGAAIESLDQSRNYAPGDRPFQAYVRVQRGCDKFCAYCVVPTVRGLEKSRRPENILADVRKLAAAGCREITLLGQTVNSYVQQDGAGRTVRFAQLLDQVCQIAGSARVRFVTNYPGAFDEDILRVMGADPRICPYLHIPAQSGSDRMLAAMRRQYSADDYYRLVDRSRDLVPGLSLAGDFIVGFPGETEADFQATAEMVRRVHYKNCFVFKYSPRPGTAAFQLKDDVPDEVKRDRNNRLLAIQAEISSRANGQLIGRTLNVLIEGASRQQLDSPASRPADRPVQLTGRSVADQIVVFPCPADSSIAQLTGQLVDVRIEQVTPYTLIGQIAQVE